MASSQQNSATFGFFIASVLMLILGIGIGGFVGFSLKADSVSNPSEVVEERIGLYKGLSARVATDFAQPQARAIDVAVRRYSSFEWTAFAEQHPSCPVLGIAPNWERKTLYYYVTLLRSNECDGDGST